MINKKKTIDKSIKKKQKYLTEAKKNFKKVQEEIEPFIKRRNLKENSTAGKWCDTSVFSSYIQENS